jgi:hypothetical protein
MFIKSLEYFKWLKLHNYVENAKKNMNVLMFSIVITVKNLPLSNGKMSQRMGILHYSNDAMF